MRHMGLNSVSKRLGKKVEAYKDPKDIVISINRAIVYSTRDFAWSDLRAWLTIAIMNKEQFVYYNKRSKNFMVKEKHSPVGVPHGYLLITEKLLYRMEEK